MHDIDLKIGFWNRIPVRLGIGVSMVSAVALIVAGVLVTRQEERQFTQQRIVDGRNDAKLIVAVLSDRMIAGGGSAVWNGLSAEAARYAALTGATRIQVLTRDGVIKASTDRSSLGHSIKVKDNPDCPRCDSIAATDFPALATIASAGDIRQLRIVNPIPKLAACSACHRDSEPFRGFIAVDFNLTALEQSERERRDNMLLLGVLSGAALLVLTGWIFRRLVMRPIDALSEAAQQMAAGQRKARAPVLGDNELAALALRFNRMAERIDAQFEEIEASNMESVLFYTLVVEASKNLETTEMAAGVHKVLRDKLDPLCLAVFIEEADARWVCVAGCKGAENMVVAGAGDLATDLAMHQPHVAALTLDVPRELIAGAVRGMELRLIEQPDRFAFAMPLVFNGKLIGMVVCVLATRSCLNEKLLNNLRAHLALAAGNSRNYTGAITDTLTGLRNKRYGLARLEEAIFAAQRYSMPLALLMCDIDHFKRINDTHGHLAGDVVLREVSRRLAAGLRKSDVAVRYGGEEFMIIVLGTATMSVSALGEKIRAAVAATPVNLGIGDGCVPITVSVGCTEFVAGIDSADTLIARADRALYRAKELGRNRVEVDTTTLAAAPDKRGCPAAGRSVKTPVADS